MTRVQRGFTIIELMVTLGIVGILVAAAAPGYQDWVATTRLNTHTNEFATALHFARSEAVKRNATVSLCKSNNGTSCLTSGAWDQGWIVFVDGGTTGIIDGTDVVLRVHETLTGGSTLVGGTGIDNSISYLSSAAPVSSGLLSMCNRKQNIGRDIRVTKDSGKPVIINDVASVTCIGGK